MTRDIKWLKEKGYPLMKKVAEFLVSRVEKNSDGSYSIKNVVGADEYAEGKTDNAFTNGAAIKALDYAIEASKLCGENTPTRWKEISRNIAIHYFPDGVTKEYIDYDGHTIIEIEGYGDKIKNFTIYEKKSDPIVQGNLKGEHNIRIELNNQTIKEIGTNLVANKSSLLTPITKIEDNSLIWDIVPEATSYSIIKNERIIATQSTTSIKLEEEGEYQVIANCNDADRNSFANEPQLWNNSASVMIHETGSINISKSTNMQILIPIVIDRDGEYAIDWLYANGNGSITDTNKCAIRNLVIDDKAIGVSIFPQRETNNWDNVGWSNTTKCKLTAGKHNIQLVFENQNENMNIETNEAIIHQLRLVLLEKKTDQTNDYLFFIIQL